MAPFCVRDRLQNKGIITSKCLKLQTKTKKRRMKDTMQARFKRLKTEMDEISEGQKNIREGQRQVREKFEAIESECEELRRETKMVIQQGAITQVKLALMFRILKKKEEGDFATSANLTQMLRHIVAREPKKKSGNIEHRVTP